MASSPSIMDADQQRDLNALMGWLRTFPRMEGKGGDECQDAARLLEDVEVATAILFVADEICDVSVACSSCKKDTDAVWNTILELVANKMPQVASRTQATSAVADTSMRTFLLSSLLCFAVSEACQHRRTYIERIMGLPSHVQQVLMVIIEKGQSEATTTTPPPAHHETPKKRSGSKRSLDESSNDSQPESERPSKHPSTGDDKSVGEKSWATDQSFGSNMLPGFTPQRKRLSVESLFSPATIDNSLEQLVSELRKQNESLKGELASCQQRETDLGQKLEDSEVAFRKEMMKIESTSLHREEEAQEAYERDMAKLQQELNDLKEVHESEERAAQQLALARDEMDLLEHTKEKLADTEEKLRVCRERMEQLSDVKEALTREEEAHSTSVEECLRLENELKGLQPLRRQLEDYKTRAVDAEVKLAESQEELKRMSQITGNLSSAQKEIMEEAKIHKEEADELRRRLLDEEGAASEGPGVGEGLSELNPVVMEEMARLRNENIRLKAFAEKREDDSVQMLEERLDDSSRLADRFKEQFLSTKNELEATEGELRDAQQHVENLQTQVKEKSDRVEELGQEVDDCTAQLVTTESELKRTRQQLQESEAREDELRSDVSRLEQKATDAESLAAQRLELLESTKAELNDTVASLQAAEEREQLLIKDVSEWTNKTTAAEAAFSECESRLSETKQALDDATASLETALERGAELQQNVQELEKVKTALEGDIEAGIQTTEAALAAKDEMLDETRRNLEFKAKQELNEMSAKMNSLLEQERADREQQVAAAAEAYAQLEDRAATDRSQLVDKYDQDLVSVKSEFDEKLAALKESHESEMVTSKQQAEEERNELVTKGKAMLKKTKENAKEQVAEADNQRRKVESELAELRQNHEAYEKRSKTKIASYKQKLNFASGRITELSQSNDSMEEQITELEREKFKLREENERFRRQLGGRFGADGKVQNQLETLQKEFNAILDENRTLKKEVEKNAKPQVGELSSISESAEDKSAQRSYTRGGVSGSTLSQLRKEYEETIEALTDEKRELVMRNSAAITDVQKAEQRAWESDKQVAKLKEELTSLRLALQRLERDSEEDYEVRDMAAEQTTKENAHGPLGIRDPNVRERPRSSSSKSSSTSSHNGPSPEEPLLDLSSSDDVQALQVMESTRTEENAAATNDKPEVASKPTVDAYEFPSVRDAKKRVSQRDRSDDQGVPSLMEHVMFPAPDDSQPDCKQS